MRRRARGIPEALVVATVLVAGCLGAASPAPVTVAPASDEPSAPLTGAVAETRAAIAQALGERGLQLTDPQVPFRPAEAPRLAAAPRGVFQVVLPQDPAHGYISVYEFSDAATATDAGRQQASYVASGPGRVQFPPDTRFVVRQLGSTIIFYAWSPANSPDPRTASIQEALETVGQAITVPA